MKQKLFSNRDYNSNDGMLTAVWGPSMWHFLHTTSFNYPVNPTPTDKRNYYNFIKSLKYVLPCLYCRQNLTNNLKKSGFKYSVMDSRDSFSKWVYNLHNVVNNMLGKKCYKTYEEVRGLYENFRARCSDDKKKKVIVQE